MRKRGEDKDKVYQGSGERGRAELNRVKERGPADDLRVRCVDGGRHETWIQRTGNQAGPEDSEGLTKAVLSVPVPWGWGCTRLQR
jgi:hypothetical protein